MTDKTRTFRINARAALQLHGEGENVTTILASLVREALAIIEEPAVSKTVKNITSTEWLMSRLANRLN